MFEVKDIRVGEIKTVYAICGTMFMFYNNGDWYWDDMQYYEPVEG